MSRQRRTYPCRAHKSERWRGGEAISLHIFIRAAPDRPSRSGEEEFFDGHSKNVDSKKIWDVVIALDGLDGIQGVNEMLKGIRVERLYKTEGGRAARLSEGGTDNPISGQNGKLFHQEWVVTN